MTPDRARRLDRLLGGPLCVLCSTLRLAGTFPSRRGSVAPRPRSLLVLKLTEPGSTVLLLPALRWLQEQLPELQIDWLTTPAGRDLLEASPVFPRRHIFACGPGVPPGAWAEALRTLLRHPPEATVDADFFARLPAALAFLLCRGARAGFHNPGESCRARRRLLTHPVRWSSQIHTAAAFLALARGLLSPPDQAPLWRGIIQPGELTLPRHRPAVAELRGAASLLEAVGCPAQARLVLVNANASDLAPLRRWPVERYVATARELLAGREDLFVLWTGTSDEASAAGEAAAATGSPRCRSVAGRTTLPLLLALLDRADLLLTNDSGPAHFSSLCRTPAVVLFGPETPALYAPLHPEAVCLTATLACSPCLSPLSGKESSCPRNLCLEALEVRTVVQAAVERLQAGRSEGDV